MYREVKAVCFGEILYDVFPDEERIGGAPLNVASRLSSLGVQTEMISKVGKDIKGDDLILYLKSKNIQTQNIAQDKEYPTGTVNVTLSATGSATYEIAYPSAWDKITLSEDIIKSVQSADAFIFGSLICRDEVSRNTLLKLLPEADYKVLDFNLRPPHYSKEILLQLIQNADFIKFNDHELYKISEILGSPYHSLEQNIHFIADKFTATSICVTKGEHGAVFLKDDKLYYNSGYQINVKDTVGAGDSFLATLIANILKNEDPQKALDHACAMGALVTGKEGANPQLDEELVENFMFPLKK